MKQKNKDWMYVITILLLSLFGESIIDIIISFLFGM
jgi:hypothetical protein